MLTDAKKEGTSVSGQTDEQAVDQAADATDQVANDEGAKKPRRAPKAPVTPGDQRTLLQRIAAIMAEVQPPGKQGKADTKAGGYSYTRYDDVAAALRPLCAKHGVIMLPNVTPGSYRYTPGHPIEGGRSAPNEMDIDLELTIFNADDPADAYVLHMPGQGLDYGDKAVGKAVTYAMKNLLINLYVLNGGEDNEKDSLEGGGRQQRREQTPAERQRMAGRDAGSAARSGPAARQAGNDAGQGNGGAQAPAQAKQSPALRWFWKVVREQEIPEDVVKAYLERAYALKSTADLSDDQVKEITRWASERKATRRQILVNARAGRITDEALAERVVERYAISNIDLLTLDELADLTKWTEEKADADLPWETPAETPAEPEPAVAPGEQASLGETS